MEAFLVSPPILSALVETAPQPHMRLLWRGDLDRGSRVQVRLPDHEWTDLQIGEHLPLYGESPASLRVRFADDGQEWIVPVVDSSGRVCWQPSHFQHYADALAALLDFPILPSESTDDEDGDDGDGDYGGHGFSEEVIENGKSYALHTAAELIEKVAALQAVLPESMLDEWIEHLDRSLHATLPKSLVDTWRVHKLDVFAHLREPDLRPPKLSTKQRARYVEVLDRAARAWGLR